MYQGNTDGYSTEEKLDNLKLQVNRIASRKIDIVQEVGKVQVEDNGKFIRVKESGHNDYDDPSNFAFNGHPMTSGRISPTALRNIGNWCHLSPSYSEYIKDQKAEELFAKNFNYWFQHKQLEKLRNRRMFRFLAPTPHNGEIGTLRSMHSDLFRRMDNEVLLKALDPLMEEYPDLEVASANVNEDYFNLKLLFPEGKGMEGEIKPGDQVRGGFRLRNSEVGLSYLLIDFLVLRLICKNGMVGYEYEHGVKRRHGGKRLPIGVQPQFGQDDEAWDWVEDFNDDVATMIEECSNKENFQHHLGKMRDATGGKQVRFLNRISEENPVIPSVDLLGKQFGLSSSDKKNISSNFISARDYSKWGFVNAITEAANDSTNYESATNLEELGGRVLSFPEYRWLPFVEAEYKEAA